ncbi:hypothetical protein V2G26_020117 [Clonostachys chloroleuca]
MLAIQRFRRLHMCVLDIVFLQLLREANLCRTWLQVSPRGRISTDPPTHTSCPALTSLKSPICCRDGVGERVASKFTSPLQPQIEERNTRTASIEDSSGRRRAANTAIEPDHGTVSRQDAALPAQS